MLAPIFSWEMQRTMQRRWFHAARILLAAVPLAILLWHVIDLTTIVSDAEFRRSFSMVLGRTREYQHLLMTIHFAWIFLLAPLLAAGPILQEKKQKTLDLLLTTQQRSIDIVVGHWLAANVKLVILTAPIIPLLIWIHAFGEASPMTWIIAWIGCTWLVALPLTAWPILVAVYAQQTSAALLLSYAGNVLLLSATPILFRDAQLGLWSYAVYDGAFWQNFALFVTAPTVVCMLIAVWRLRPALGAAPERATRRSANRPTLSVSDQPILWKQMHCNDLLVPRWVRWLPRWTRVLGFIAATIGIAALPDQRGVWAGMEGIVILFAFPMFALIWTSNSIASERETGTWDSLRITSLSAEEIIMETVQAITSRLRLYWLALLPAIGLLIVERYSNCYLLVVWMLAGGAIYHGAVAGIHSSFSMRLPWGSILFAATRLMVVFILYSIPSVTGAVMMSSITLLCSAVLQEHWERYSWFVAATIAIVFSVVFLSLMYTLFNARSTYLIIVMTEYLARNDGFQRRRSRIPDAFSSRL
jgi:hypothetical protein